MTNLTQIYVGVDIAKENLDIHLNPIGKFRTVKNNPEGIKELMETLSQYTVLQVVYESSGGYEYLLSKELAKKGYKQWQLEPQKMRAFIVTEGIKAKNDRIDAKMIALFAAQKLPKYVKALRQEADERLHALNKRRSDLSNMLVEEMNRRSHPAQIYCKEQIDKHIEFMKHEVKALDKQIEILIKSNVEWSKKLELINSVPGMGKVSASLLISALPELGKLSDKEIAALVGVAPFIHQSGASKGVYAIKGGRSNIRRMLYMCSVVAIRYNAKLKEFYDRLRQANKCFKVAIVAVMRKLIVILNTLLAKEENWRVS